MEVLRVIDSAASTSRVGLEFTPCSSFWTLASVKFALRANCSWDSLCFLRRAFMFLLSDILVPYYQIVPKKAKG